MSAPDNVLVPDPEEFIRLTGAVTAAEAEEGFRIFTEKLTQAEDPDYDPAWAP